MSSAASTKQQQATAAASERPQPQSILRQRPEAVFNSLSLRLGFQTLPPDADTVQQARLLCRDYVYHRLRAHNVIGHQMPSLRTAHGAASSDVGRDVLLVGSELEKAYPNLYQHVGRQLAVNWNFHDLPSHIRETLVIVSDLLFRNNNVSWGRIVSMLAVCGGMAVDCVMQERADIIETIVDAFGDIANKHFALWINQHGGWAEIAQVVRSNRDPSALWLLSGLGVICGFIVTLFTTLQA